MTALSLTFTPCALGTGFLTTISNCINEKRSIDIVYKSKSRGKTEERRVDPYGLVFYEGLWYLIGYCHIRKEIRHFALDNRVIDLKEKWMYFKPAGDFSMDEHLSHSWEIYKRGEKIVNVVIKFSSKVRDRITKKKWHLSEKMRILEIGEVELSFGISGINEIKKWIYSWMPHVEVVEPGWFRKQINRELRISLGKHTIESLT